MSVRRDEGQGETVAAGPTSPRSALVATSLVFAIILGSGLALVPPGPVRAAQGIEKIAEIPLPYSPGAANINLLMDASPGVRLLYEISSSGSRVVIRSADPPFAVLRTVDLASAPASPGRTVLAAVDEVRHRLFVPTVIPSSVPQPGGNIFRAAAVHVIDGLTGAVLGRIPIVNSDSQTAMLNPRFKGMTYDPKRDRLYALLQDHVLDLAGLPRLGVQALDPTGCIADPACASSGSGFLEWSYLLQNCQVPMLALGNIPGVPADPKSEGVYVPCTVDGSGGTRTPPRHTQGIYRLETDGLRPPTTHTFAPVHGDFRFGGALFDPGSARFVLHSRDFGPAGDFIFDGGHMTTIGIVEASGNLFGACMNLATGRYYANVTTGVQTSEARATPSQAGTEHPEFYDASTSPAAANLLCDRTTSRVFVPVQRASQLVLLVLEDDNPPYVASPPTDADALTSDVEDNPRVSRATYNSVGRAFGARVAMLGGTQTVQRSYSDTSLVGAPNAGPFSPLTGTLDDKSDRVVTFAQVGISEKSVSLSNGGVQAVATGGGHDEATRNNFTGNGDHESPWPFEAVSCPGGVDEDGNAVNDSATRGASVKCRPTGKSPSAFGHAEAGQRNFDSEGQLARLLSIEGAEATVETHLDPKLGIVVTARAQVRTLTLGGGRIVVENASAEAVASAKGQRGKARASYTRSIGRLEIEGEEICAPCDPKDVARGITQATNQVVTASLPKLDEALANGTTMGVQAGIVRHAFEQLTDETLNSGSPYDQQVPALRLVFQARGYQNNVVILDLAAPQAVSFRALAPCSYCALTPEVETPPAGRGQSAAPAPPPIDAASRVVGVGRATPTGPETTTYITTSAGTGAAAMSGSSGGLVERVLEAIRKGLDTLFTSPGRIPMLLAIWALMLSPVYLSSRRRLIPAHSKKVSS